MCLRRIPKKWNSIFKMNLTNRKIILAKDKAKDTKVYIKKNKKLIYNLLKRLIMKTTIIKSQDI